MKSKLTYLIITVVLLGSVAVISAPRSAEIPSGGELPTQADVIVIDSMKGFGKLERSAVVFQHDKHTEALELRGEDCSTCHIDYGIPYVFLYNRFDNPNKDAVLTIYHDGCMGCHEKDRSANVTSGPIECAECHANKPALSFSQQLPDFNKSLHQRHIIATNNDCGSCHHGYDLNASVKALGYEKGKETSCRDCHLAENSKKIKSYRNAAHRLCVNCHLSPSSQNITSTYQPPSTSCAECHDPERLAQIKEIDPVPRLERGQPDFTFLKTADDPNVSMDMVVFNHERHEFASDDCRTCHHKSMDRCESCHSIDGREKGDWITLAKAMHQGDSEHGCIGCHASETRQGECAGCHTLMTSSGAVPGSDSCQQCHIISIDGILPTEKSAEGGQYHTTADIVTTADHDSLPDIVEIGVISNEYGAVSFPHRQIIESLMNQIEGNHLAAYFHQDRDAICASCHHNAPDLRSTPPKCISCHEPARSKQVSSIPDLATAYHQQCFTCHDTMNIKAPVSTECESCHLKNQGIAQN